MLTIKNLKIQFHTKTKRIVAVEAVDLNVRAGETLLLVGESGAGKSVLARSILGVLPKNAGVSADQMLFDGQRLLDLSEKGWMQIRGSKLSIVFQEPLSALNPVLSIGDQLTEILIQHELSGRPAAQARSCQMLSELGIEDPETALNKYPHQLSGGERQRAAIAMALICEPKLIILDEPTTALDVFTKEDLLQLLKKRQKKDKFAMILITHDLAFADWFADGIAVMYKGALLECGESAEIIKHPKKAYTKYLLSAIPVLGSGKGRINLSGSRP